MSPRLWLIVAAMDDPLARDVVGDLRRAGERAILVDSAALVRAYAQTDIPCVLFLPEDQHSLPEALAVASTLEFAAHIPIGNSHAQAEPWMSAVVDGSQPATDIVNQLQAEWEAVATQSVEERQARATAYHLQPTPLPEISKSESKRRGRQKFIWRVGTFAAIIQIVSLLFTIYNAVNLHAEIAQDTLPPPFPIGQAYFAQVPGPCPGAQGTWYWDQKDTYSCQNDGLLMKRIDLAYIYNMNLALDTGTVAGYFQSSYAVQVTGTINDINAGPCIGLEVHEQQGNLGSQVFFACKDGTWSIDRLDTSGKFSTYLGYGNLAYQRDTYTLGVDAHGTTMTFMVDGTTLDTVDDPTYTTTDGIGLIFSDAATLPGQQEALFSDLFVTPHGNAAPDDAQKQALLADQQLADSPYQARLPGDGCDIGGNGGWSPVGYENDPTHVSFLCQPNGFIMIPPTSGSIAQEDFFNRVGAFPPAYQVATTLTFDQQSGICAGISTSFHTALQRLFMVCGDNTWRVYHLATDGSAVTDSSGNVPRAATYRLSVKLEAGNETLTLNGVPLGAPLTPLTSGDATTFVSLVNYSYAATNSAAPVVFSDFSFAPIA